MNPTARDGSAADAEPLTPEQEATARAAGVWVHQLARTLKTCRLYDTSNPTVQRFRGEIAGALRTLLDQNGTVQLRFTADDVTCEGQSLYPARSRDDNLALPFFRDGIRGITFTPGIEAREVEVLVDSVLLVTGQNFVEDDLVTLLWEAQLPHIDVQYVPAEGEIGGGGATPAAEETVSLLPWPAGGAVAGEETGSGAEAPAAEVETVTEAGKMSRSDDWSAGDLTVEIEAGFEELESLAPTEVERFRKEFEAEHSVSLVTSALAVAHAYLRAGAAAEDRQELARFLPRVLRQAFLAGDWLEAREALLLLQECDTPEWSVDAFAQEMLQPISVSSTVEKLDPQDGEAPLHFIAFARELGDTAVDWLNLVLAESQNRKHRRLIAESIAALCHDRPERLAPWIADPRWFVVRNIVHILGWIGGPGIVPLLQVAARNPDPRVRQEVIGALGQVELKVARPLLVRLLETGDSRQFCSVLHQLAGGRDAGVARLMLGYIQDPAFENRPLDEKNAIYAALSTAGGDEVVAELEAELHKGNWFSRQQEAHRQAVARILARIGTVQARATLERGAQSRRPPVKKACEDALGGFRDAA